MQDLLVIFSLSRLTAPSRVCKAFKGQYRLCFLVLAEKEHYCYSLTKGIDYKILHSTSVYMQGTITVCHFMNITIRLLGGVSILGMFTMTRSHGYVNTTTWLGISQFF